ncbi:hypothetical protein [Pseudonocardia endophytica]|uniref:Uncharacterized protein n=1 Tax=Pseudonocardia endophytica TaxID=401976 RepID=A0A4R1HMJ9_PSEEN|nr:hypothetical protein [Pseudonocardia endophytica]TCK22273.1 hypothetical protein EV378_6274 [Pseudonocardia endophytica]
MSQPVPPPPAGEPVLHHRPSPRPAPDRPADDGWGGGWASLPAEPAEPAEESSPPTLRIPVQAPAAAPRHETRSPDEDSSGRPLGMRFPSWDLLPPTEFVQRHRGR